MENRVSVISIIVKDEEAAVTVNDLLHEYRHYIVGRMGLPYRQQRCFDHQRSDRRAPVAASSLSGKLGMVEGVTAKTAERKTIRIYRRWMPLCSSSAHFCRL